MTNEAVEKLSNDLKDIAKKRDDQVTELDMLEKKVTGETTNWTGEARAKRLESEIETAEIENKIEFTRMVKKFDEALQLEFEKVGVDNIKNAIALPEMKEMSKKLNITLTDLNMFLVEQARITEASLLFGSKDPFSELVLRKMYALDLLKPDLRKRVRSKFNINGNTNTNAVLKQLQNGRDFIVGQIEKRTPEELKQINLGTLLDKQLPVIA